MKAALIVLAFVLPGCFQAVSDEFGAHLATGSTTATAGSSGTTSNQGPTGTSGAVGSTVGSTGAVGTTSASSSAASSSSGVTAGSSTTGTTGASDFSAGGTTGYGNWSGIESCSDGATNPLFLPPQAFPVAENSENLLPGGVLADVTGDGRLDVVVAGQDNWGGNLIIWQNVGNGLAPLSTVPLGFYPAALQMEDVSGDGIADAIVRGTSLGGRNGEVGVLVSDGHGDWRGPTTYLVGSTLPVVALADVDGDGLADLLAAGDESPSVGLYLNQGDGSFAPPSIHSRVAKAPIAWAGRSAPKSLKSQARLAASQSAVRPGDPKPGRWIRIPHPATQPL